MPFGDVLADGVLDGLRIERVLEFGREDRNPVQKQHEIEALLVLLDVAQLPHHGEKVRGVQLLELGRQIGR